MTRTILSALLLLAGSSLQAADNPWRISILASEIATTTRAGYEDDHTGVGIGIAYAPTPQWDAELTVASRTYALPYTRLFAIPGPDGTLMTYPVTEFHSYRATPVDLSVTRHFLADSPLAPYVRAGVRYVQAPKDAVTFVGPGGGVQEGFNLSDRTSAQAGAGLRLRLTPRTALRGEVTRLLRSEGAAFDPLTRYAVGVSWMF